MKNSKIDNATEDSNLSDYLLNLESIGSNKNADFMDVYHAKRLALGAHYQIDHLYTNDGPREIGSNDFSRTAIAHKIMFDHAKGEKVRIFAKGLHKNIYDTKIVVNAFRDYIAAVLCDDSEYELSDVLPIEVICNGRESKDILLREISELEVCHEAKRLLMEYPGKVDCIFEIHLADPDEKLDITPIKISYNEGEDANAVDILDKVSILSSGWLSAFSVFGDSYRFRRSHGEKQHFAYINFGDPEVAEVLVKNFDAIKASEGTELIFTV